MLPHQHAIMMLLRRYMILSELTYSPRSEGLIRGLELARIISKVSKYANVIGLEALLVNQTV